MSWLTGLEDQLLAWLLVYGYPVLGLTLLAGAIGFPLPSGAATVIAGALAAQGHLSWLASGLVAMVASVAGDTFSFSIGRWAGQGFLEQRGRWIGLTPGRLVRARSLFARWGWLSILLSRSLLSFLSPAVNLLAGGSGYRLRSFFPFDVMGRLAWTSAYLGFGYLFGGSLEAAADFLSSLSGLLVSAAGLAGLGFVAYRHWCRSAKTTEEKPERTGLTPAPGRRADTRAGAARRRSAPRRQEPAEDQQHRREGEHP